ncbi:MAG: hypothetical protein ACLUUG_13680 [Lachnospiraceae bacterium]
MDKNDVRHVLEHIGMFSRYISVMSGLVDQPCISGAAVRDSSDVFEALQRRR